MFHLLGKNSKKPQSPPAPFSFTSEGKVIATGFEKKLFIPLFNSFISFYAKLQVFKQFISPVLYYLKYSLKV